MQMCGSEVDMDVIVTSSGNEAEYEKGLFDSRTMERYVKGRSVPPAGERCRAIYRASAGERRRDPIYACAYNTRRSIRTTTARVLR